MQAGSGALAMLQGLVSSISSVTSSAYGMARAAGTSVVRTPVNVVAGGRQRCRSGWVREQGGTGVLAAAAAGSFWIILWMPWMPFSSCMCTPAAACLLPLLLESMVLTLVLLLTLLMGLQLTGACRGIG